MDFNKQKTWMIWYIIAAVFAALLLQQIWNTSRQTEAIPYSKFEQLVTDKKIAEVVIDSDMIEGTLKEPGPDGKNKFVTIRVDPAIAISSPPKASRFLERRIQALSAPSWPGRFPPLFSISFGFSSSANLPAGKVSAAS